MICMFACHFFFFFFIFYVALFALDGFTNPQGVSPPESFEMINSLDQSDNSGE